MILRAIFTCVLSLAVCVGATQGAIVGLEAESGTITDGSPSGATFNTIVDTGDPGPLGDKYIINSQNSTTGPNANDPMASYSVNIPSAGTYYLYVKVWVPSTGSASHDSIYYPSEFGASPTFSKANNLQNGETDTYVWANISSGGFVGYDGNIEYAISAPGAYTVGAGLQTFSILGREDPRIDAIAFSTDNWGENDTDKIAVLDAAVVPEPASFGLLGLGGLLLIARRRRR